MGIRVAALSILFLFTTSSILACGPGINSNTGGDGARGDARDIQVDTTLDDRVSAAEGDNSDWKRFEIDGSASVKVLFWWDDADVEVNVALRDELGQKLKALSRKGPGRHDILGPVNLKEGTYFIEISATSGASVYTFEVQTGDGAGDDEPDF